MRIDDYRAALAADDAWGAELRRVFGKNAGEARYQLRGEGVPGSLLRRLYDAKLAADAALEPTAVAPASGVPATQEDE